MIREFKFFRGYEINPFVVEWEQMNNHLIQPLTWPGTTTNTPTWITNPGYIVPQPYTITTTPGTGTYTIPFSGTISGLSTGFSLTTSNPTGTVTTMGGIGGAFTTTGTISTNTFYNSNIK
jgi:hypothetical protein